MATSGENIRALRKLCGLTQEELANKSGISTMSIRRYESNLRDPNIETLRRISKALNAELYLLSGDIEDNMDVWFRNQNSETLEEKLALYFDKLNEEGQQKAIERVEELTEIPKYQRKPEEGEQNAVGPQENDKDRP